MCRLPAGYGFTVIMSDGCTLHDREHIGMCSEDPVVGVEIKSEFQNKKPVWWINRKSNYY